MEELDRAGYSLESHSCLPDGGERIDSLGKMGF